MINLPDLTVFVESIRAGSLASAGRRLGITPMAASRRLAALESELGVRLVHRTTRALALTPDGEAFFPYAETLLEQEENARAALKPANAGVSGLLRVAASVPFGRKIVTPMISRFMTANPEVRVELLLSDGLVDIAAQGIDLALRLAEPRDSAMIARKLASNPRGLYASPSYLARRSTPELLADLSEQECLALAGTTHWTFLREDQTVQQRVSGRFSADSIEALHCACIEGMGIARLSAWNVTEDLAAGRLVEIVLSDVRFPEQGVWAIYPTRRFVPPKVRIFIAAFEEHLANSHPVWTG
ncbi:LysR family transcriptional regulator [Sphingomonas sp. OTU376]|uniref:LysR family transcriptional regulator n=1 Tax=Sphingomonas sp. OTU376 TaxID=3043863 RepID=UPI00313E32D4